MPDTLNTSTATEFVASLSGRIQVDGPLDLGLLTPVTFSGTGRISGQAIDEPFMEGRPTRATYSVAIENIDYLAAVGAEQGVASVTAAEKAETAAKASKAARFWGRALVAFLFVSQALVFINIGASIAGH